MSTVTIHSYRPGAIGEIVRHHALYYDAHWSFDVRFESQVSRELGEFMSNFDPSRDGLWWAAVDGEFAGAMVVNGTTVDKREARLRWFIVPEKYQSMKVGGQLMERAMQFCRDADFDSVYLWTFDGLAAARKLYERHGFRLTQTQESTDWGPHIVEQKFELDL